MTIVMMPRAFYESTSRCDSRRVDRSFFLPDANVVTYCCTWLALEGRDVYVREGCYNCHSQMVRPLPAETERYGHYSLAGETVYDHPFQFGSKRTGPDLARVGGRYTDEWHRVHLLRPRDVVPESNMPGFPWLEQRQLDPAGTQDKMRALRALGVPYSPEEVEAAQAAVAGRSEMDAVIAYLQRLRYQGAGASTKVQP